MKKTKDMLNKTAEIFEMLSTKKMKDVTKEQLELICEKLQELNIRQREQLEEDMHTIGELDHYCFIWAGLQKEIVRMIWYVDALKNNEKLLDSKIEKMKQKIDMKDKMLKEAEKRFEN